MEFKIKDKNNSQKEIEITVSKEEIESFFNKTAEKISTQIEIKGFRSGKAPKKIVEDTVGKDKFWQEAVYDAIDKTYLKAIEKTELFVVSSPEIEVIKSDIDQDLIYKVIVEVFPEVKLPDYKEISKKILIDKKNIEVDNLEVEKVIETIRKSRAKIAKVTRSAQKGDEVEIDFIGKIDNIEQEDLKGEKIKIILGEKRFIDGFEDQVIGMKTGEKKDITVKMPKINDNQKQEEKDVNFSVKLIEVYERSLPELDDELVKSLGDFKDVEALKSKIKENIKEEKKQKEKERLRIKIVEEIAKDAKAEIPQSMIKKEKDNMMEEFKHQLSHSGATLEDYLKQAQKTEDDIKKDWDDQAKKRIMTGLILYEIAKKEEIKISDEEVEKETTSYFNRIHDQKIREQMNVDKAKNYIRDLLQNEKVFELLEESK